MCLLRWSRALHLALLCWLAAAVQVIEGKTLSQHLNCKEMYSRDGSMRGEGGLKQSGTDPADALLKE